MTFATELHSAVAAEPPAATRGFVLNHTMLRVKDPAVALDFYSRVLGLRLVRRLDFPEMSFSLYFLASPEQAGDAPDAAGARTAWTFSQRGVLELTHNWGTEGQPDFRYHDGNAQPQGYGHVGFAVPDLDAAVRWLDDCGVAWVKRPEQGKLRDVAFFRDPDGYWIEIFEPARLTALGGATGGGNAA